MLKLKRKVKRFKLKVLSPVHIGDGNFYIKWDIGKKDNYIYIFDIDKVFNSLDSGVLQELIQELSSANSNYKDLGEFLEKKAENLNWEDLCKYKIEFSGYIGEKLPKIYSFIKEGLKPFIPGSTIKGFIRTAVIYTLMKEKGYRFEISKGKNNREYIVMIKPDSKKIGRIKNGKTDFQIINEEIFKDFCGQNASNDVFKYLIVSDSQPVDISNLKAYKVYVGNTTSFVKIRHGKKIYMTPEFYECLIPNTEFEGIEIKIMDLKETDIDKKYKETYEKIQNWEECVKIFIKDILNAELQFWEKEKEKIENNIHRVYYKNKDITDKFRCENVKNFLEELKKSVEGGNLIIRLGKLSGYFSHSVGLLMANGYDIGKFGKLIFPFYHTGEVSPLTRRLTVDSQLLGWCQLEEVQR